MKNTALILTSSIVVTQFIMMCIFAVDIQSLWSFYDAFWSGLWELNILGWICLLVACATLVLAFFFGYQKKMFVSYSLGATAGVFLGILLYMVNLMVLD